MSAEIRPQAAERESEIAAASNRANQCHGEIFPVWPSLQRLFRQLVKRRIAVRETLPVFRVTCGRFGTLVDFRTGVAREAESILGAADAVDFRQLREIVNRSPSLGTIFARRPCTKS
jgi:hypothetical protein